MKSKIFYLIAFIIITSYYSISAQDAHQFTLTVKVNHLRNEKGVVQFALYNQDGSLPDEKYNKTYKIGRSAIDDHSASYHFTRLPPGMYAVNILHDENENQTIDKGIIKPKEGIGFSNFSRIGLTNMPTFSKAMIEVAGHRTIEVKVIYF